MAATDRAGWKSLALLIVGRMVTANEIVAAQAPASPARRVIISLPDRKLALVENDQVVRVFSVAVGAPLTPSPVGTFTIVNRLENPTYYGGRKVVGPGPANPLGTRWLGLSLRGYGIHGTDNPRSIGYARSHGCIRMRNRDVEELFERLRPGDVVELHDARSAEIARVFGQTSAPAAP